MGPSEYFMMITFIGMGVFSIVASVFNFDWYFKTSAATTFVNWLGRRGARVFYILLGIGLVICGILGLLDLKDYL